MNQIQLRDVVESDLPILFDQQNDSVANEMAAFPARDRDAFVRHWKDKILRNPKAFKKTIVQNRNVVGNILCWEQDGKFLVGYWIGRSYWGQGIATRALELLLTQIKSRPLFAHVAKHNLASIRVLEKCGFQLIGQGTIHSEGHGGKIVELHMRLP